MKFGDFVSSEAIRARLAAEDKEGAIREMIGGVLEAGKISADEVESIVKAILKREELGSTGIGRGVAVPHTKHPSVQRLVGTVAVSSDGIDFNSLDGEKVQLFFLLISPPDRPGDHLRALENISRQLRDDTFLQISQTGDDRQGHPATAGGSRQQRLCLLRRSAGVLGRRGPYAGALREAAARGQADWIECGNMADGTVDTNRGGDQPAGIARAPADMFVKTGLPISVKNRSDQRRRARERQEHLGHPHAGRGRRYAVGNRSHGSRCRSGTRRVGGVGPARLRRKWKLRIMAVARARGRPSWTTMPERCAPRTTQGVKGTGERDRVFAVETRFERLITSFSRGIFRLAQTAIPLKGAAHWRHDAKTTRNCRFARRGRRRGTRDGQRGISHPSAVRRARRGRHELERLDAAIAAARRRDRAQSRRGRRELGEQYGAVFSAHLQMLRDPTLRGELEAMIRERHYSPEYAVSRALRRYAKVFQSIENSYLAERANDIFDIEKRLLRNLLGRRREEIVAV